MFKLSATNELHTTYIPSGHDVKKGSGRRRTPFFVLLLLLLFSSQYVLTSVVVQLTQTPPKREGTYYVKEKIKKRTQKSQCRQSDVAGDMSDKGDR